MARTALSGLFGGSSELDVLGLMRREEEAASKQARAFPTSTASIAAAAQQEGKNALKKMFGGVAGGLGLDVAVDPKLAKARKRETDKREIMGILQEYATDGFSEEEMNQGYALLMRKGYPEEARKFLADAKMMVDMERLRASTELDKAKAATEGKEGKGKVQSSKVISEAKDPATGIKYTQSEILYKSGMTEVIVRDQYGNQYNLEEYKELVKNKKLESVGPRGLTKEEREDEDRVKEAGKLFVKEKSDARQNLRKNEELVKKARQAIAILPKIKTGGLATKFMGITNYFGLTDENVGQFNNITAKMLLKSLGQLGANPTEGERQFIQTAEAGMLQGREVNDRILKELVKILQRKISLDTFLTKPNTSLKQWEEKLSKRSQELSDDLLGLSDSFINPIKVPANILNKGPSSTEVWLKKQRKATKGYYFIGPNGEIRQLGK